MKVAFCLNCGDIVGPHRAWRANRAWRWCECEYVGVRWRDGDRGLLEVASMRGADYVRVVGLNNAFLEGTAHGVNPSDVEWRTFHETTCAQVERRYVFHESKRNCWAALLRIGETADITLIDFETAKGYVRAADEA